MGTSSESIQTANGKQLLNLCGTNTLKTGDSLFQQKRTRKLTWRSPDNAIANHTDHVCMFKRWASLRNVRVRKGADVVSDHYLLVAMLQPKLQEIMKTDKNCYNNREVQEQKHRSDARLPLAAVTVFYRTRLMKLWKTNCQNGRRQ
ncbi:hypothetical protein KIL84_016619 [Mauremys mutica]|uniref:Uncharacterized protein n=1 Tax=Mauremys mutica TaxID=74926 RepID=A0A9D3X4X0_9SAUR|nr:hypothetical protein KIL84_016619 [Mauremys mutica]